MISDNKSKPRSLTYEKVYSHALESDNYFLEEIKIIN